MPSTRRPSVPPPSPARRPRGVYRCASPDPTLPGYHRVEVWTRDGRLLALTDIHPDAVTPETDAVLRDWLNDHDPVGPWSGPRRFTPVLPFPTTPLGSRI